MFLQEYWPTPYFNTIFTALQAHQNKFIECNTSDEVTTNLYAKSTHSKSTHSKIHKTTKSTPSSQSRPIFGKKPHHNTELSLPQDAVV